jgi:hypothetical protein
VILPRWRVGLLLMTALLSGCAATHMRNGYRENQSVWADFKAQPAFAPWTTCIDIEIATQTTLYRTATSTSHRNKGESFVNILGACKDQMAGFDWSQNIDANVERMISAAYYRFGLALEEETKAIARGLLL